MNRNLGIVIAILVAVAAFAIWHQSRPQTMHVSDMKFVVESFDWTEPKTDQSIDGNPIRIADQIYARGISTHATTTIFVD
ncbi:MAG TPA: NPCBM/NEW2 domain-containing protein, partial [bacterium]|nr:NPCBM/NEW2 domain-containing protein [bacterium]